MSAWGKPVVLLSLIVILILSGCGTAPVTGPMTVAVSIPPQAFLVSRIAGPHAQVITLLKPGDSPATFQPDDHLISRIMGSRIYFSIGVPFEKGAWSRALASAGASLRVVDLTKGIELRPIEHTHDSGHDHRSGLDPHIWLSTGNLKILARSVAVALSEIDPENKGVFDANLAGLLEEIDRVDGEIRQILSPHRGKALHVYHPAWGYFCHAFGLTQVPIEIEGKEPTDHELTEFQVEARAGEIRVIYVQPQIVGRSARILADAVGADLKTLDPLAVDVLENLRGSAAAIAEGF